MAEKEKEKSAEASVWLCLSLAFFVSREAQSPLKVSSYFQIEGLVGGKLFSPCRCECVKKGNEYTSEVDHAEESDSSSSFPC